MKDYIYQLLVSLPTSTISLKKIDDLLIANTSAEYVYEKMIKKTENATQSSRNYAYGWGYGYMCNANWEHMAPERKTFVYTGTELEKTGLAEKLLTMVNTGKEIVFKKIQNEMVVYAD